MNEVTKALLLDYHAGRVTSLQCKLIEDWLQVPGNMAVYYETLIEWECTHPQYVADVSVGLDRFRERITSAAEKETAAVSPPAVHRLNSRYPINWLVAASIAVVLTVGWLFRTPLLYQTYRTTNGEVKRIVLPDQSRVTLNANSSLRLSRFNWLKSTITRDVFLTGEAEFSVTHLADNRRFVVHTEQHLDVEVLGTEFVMLARHRATHVVLIKGKVKLHYQLGNGAGKVVTMKPGQKVTLNPRQDKLMVAPVPRPEDYSAWKNHQYVFDDTSLRDIGQLIQDDFGLKVQIKDTTLAQRQVSGTYDVADVNELLNALQELLSIQVTRQRGRIIFSEKTN